MTEIYSEAHGTVSM